MARWVERTRARVARVLQGRDRRFLVLVGPCSIHDPVAAYEYAQRLAGLALHLSRHLLIVMRVFFQKSRTCQGWSGLVSDPYRDGSFALNDGMHMARSLLLRINALGLPASSELLDPFVDRYYGDLLSLVLIGARSCESQLHRAIASSLSYPVGIKNSTTGDVMPAVNAMLVARNPQSLLTVDATGAVSVLKTKGNVHTCLVLRGGVQDTNYDSDSVQRACDQLNRFHLLPRVLIDCAHDNSKKCARQQLEVAHYVLTHLSPSVIGVMLESFLQWGRQDETQKLMRYGVSVTDECIDWETTVTYLEKLSTTVSERAVLVNEHRAI